MVNEIQVDKGQYAVLPSHVIRSWPDLSGSAKAVIVAVASFMSAKGKCFPGVETLKTKSGLKKPHTIAKALNELQEKGILKKHRRPNRSNLYSWPEGVMPAKFGHAAKRHNRNSGNAH